MCFYMFVCFTKTFQTTFSGKFIHNNFSPTVVWVGSTNEHLPVVPLHLRISPTGMFHWLRIFTHDSLNPQCPAARPPSIMLFSHALTGLTLSSRVL